MDRRTRRNSLRRSDDNTKKLILEAAASAEDPTASPPPELTLAWQVERWGAAAVIGDRIPARLLKRMTVSANIHTAFRSYQAGKYRLADWARANPLHTAIVAEIRLMRQHYDR